MTAFLKNSAHQKPNHQTTNDAQQIRKNGAPIFNSSFMAPLDDTQYLLNNAYCFQELREIPKTKMKKKKMKIEEFQFTTQYLYGCYMPPYYSVLNFSLMNKLVIHLQNPNAPTSKLFMMHKEIIEHEQELFMKWLSNTWEEKFLKNRRLNRIPHVEDYIKSACNFSSNYTKTHYNGSYRSKMKIIYNREEDIVANKVEMTYCQRVKSSDIMYNINLPTIKITNLESKVSFTSSSYNAPQKLPFIKDELCRTLSNEHGSDVNICLSSIKHIMNLEKPNSVWIIPININIDTDNRKTIYIGGALSTGHFSQQEKSLYYLRKEIKRKFRKIVSITTNADQNVQNNANKYNYDKWTLKHKEINGAKSFNLLVRSKPHIQNKDKSTNELYERVLIPKVEYQPEFGYEKYSEEQLVEYWLDTYFRNPKCNYTLVSVQYNMDIMMIKQKNVESNNLISDDKKQMYLQRLYLTMDKFSQLDKGEYVMLHNPKNPFQNEIYQSSMYGGFNLLNMYSVLQQSEVSNSLTWNPIDKEIICPIHDYFKVAPCMFKPNSIILDIESITKQVEKFKSVLEAKQNIEKQRIANRKKIKAEKTKAKKKLQREHEKLFKVKQTNLIKGIF